MNEWVGNLMCSQIGNYFDESSVCHFQTDQSDFFTSHAPCFMSFSKLTDRHIVTNSTTGTRYRCQFFKMDL